MKRQQRPEEQDSDQSKRSRSFSLSSSRIGTSSGATWLNRVPRSAPAPCLGMVTDETRLPPVVGDRAGLVGDPAGELGFDSARADSVGRYGAEDGLRTRELSPLSDGRAESRSATKAARARFSSSSLLRSYESQKISYQRER